MSDDYERRLELATKIATLEERSVQSQTQLNRIEAMLTGHAKDEENILKDIHRSINDFKDMTEDRIDEVSNRINFVQSNTDLKLKDLSTEIDTKVNAAVGPLKEERSFLRGGWKTVTVIAGFVFAVILAFKDAILKAIIG